MMIDFATLLSVIGILGGGTGVAAIIVSISSRKKTKAEATKIIEQAAAAQVERLETEARRWRDECHDLRQEVTQLSEKVEDTTACQKDLRGKVAALEEEKKDLSFKLTSANNRITELEMKMASLIEENRRLKEERDNEKGLMA